MSSRPVDIATFDVIDTATGKTVFSSPVTGKPRAWNKNYPNTYTLDFSKLSSPGSYRVAVKGPPSVASPDFRIGEFGALYSPLVANAAAFYAAQHDQHQDDASAIVYQTPTFSGDNLTGKLTAIVGAADKPLTIDVSGGWYDAGDYLEFVETASYADAALLLTARDHPNSPVSAEARRGLEWLLKMWDPNTKTLYYQVGVGDGNETVRGDHDAWRLPSADNEQKDAPGTPDDFLKHRPVFRAGPAGSPVSPNLAGRLAAAFALGSQLYRPSDPAFADRCLQSAKTVYTAAQTDGVKQLLTTAPFGYYGESEWRDDMEWGATELFGATADRAFLQSAAKWAHAYLTDGGGDVLNLYDAGPLAHYELAMALPKGAAAEDLSVSRQELIDALRRQLDQASRRAKKDPFALGLAYRTGDLTPHVIGLALEASFYDALTHTTTFQSFGSAQRRWILGGNAWGVSFIVGAGSTFPRHLHHQIANLTGNTLTGAVLDGPSGEREVARTLKEIPDGARTESPGPDPYLPFSAQGVRFTDNVAAYPCVEPALDYAAFSALLFSREP